VLRRNFCFPFRALCWPSKPARSTKPERFDDRSLDRVEIVGGNLALDLLALVSGQSPAMALPLCNGIFDYTNLDRYVF
jgi:hypothetical protein